MCWDKLASNSILYYKRSQYCFIFYCKAFPYLDIVLFVNVLGFVRSNANGHCRDGNDEGYVDDCYGGDSDGDRSCNMFMIVKAAMIMVRDVFVKRSQ